MLFILVAAFNQEKALVGAFSVITNLRMELFQALRVLVASMLPPVAAPPAWLSSDQLSDRILCRAARRRFLRGGKVSIVWLERFQPARRSLLARVAAVPRPRDILRNINSNWGSFFCVPPPAQCQPASQPCCARYPPSMVQIRENRFYVLWRDRMPFCRFCPRHFTILPQSVIVSHTNHLHNI